MNALRAYKVFITTVPEEGCLLAFASTRNQARYLGRLFIGGLLDCDYVDLSAIRVPEYDEIAVGERPYYIATNNDLPEGAASFYSDPYGAEGG